MTMAEQRATCGIIMPIGAIGSSYTEQHWESVRIVLERAIINAGLEPQPVWENQATEVIQGRIIKNIYENQMMVCDVSGLNSNVMLELGMRLSTKKPTILVADKKDKLPFDTSIIAHSFYDADLEYNKTVGFINELSENIKTTWDVAKAGSYRSFMENFEFETVIPTPISVSIAEQLSERLDKVAENMARIEQRMQNQDGPIDRIPVNRSTLPFGVKDVWLPADYVSPFQVGDFVGHSKFGNGVVAEVDRNKLEIEFVNGVGRKRVLDNFIKPAAE